MSNLSLQFKQQENILGKDFLQDLDKDIYFVNNDIAVTFGSQGIHQKLKNKLLSYTYSLFAHPWWGGFYQALVGKNMTKRLINEARTVGIRQFLEEPEVQSVDYFDVQAFPEVRTLSTTAKIQYITTVDTEDLQVLSELE